MGWGGFGSNGSVHWQINYKDKGPPAHVDYDDTKKHPGNTKKVCAAIGAGAGKTHEGQFRVTARYDTRVQALAALAEAQKKLKNSKARAIELDVELRPYHKVKTTPGSPSNWEVMVNW
jgi:hypothetical protein